MSKLLLILGLFATAAPAEEKIKGGLDKSVIDETIKRAMPMFMECYKKAEPAPTGRIATKFSIDNAGKVTKASIGKNTLNSPVVETCVTDTLKGLLFPAPEGGGTVDVEYPFAFSPSAENRTKEKTVDKKKKH